MFLWELFSRGQQPYSTIPGLGEVAHVILEGQTPSQPAGCPSALYELMQRCWNVEPKRRPDIEVRYWAVWEREECMCLVFACVCAYV